MKAVYAGSFDPITNGHRWVIDTASNLFERVVVAVGINPQKSSYFSPEERLRMIEQSIAGMHNVAATIFENQFLVRFAQQIEASVIVRGIRSEQDYSAERTMQQVNEDLNPDIITIYLIPPPDLEKVSSSIVRSLVGFDGWEGEVVRYVPAAVLEKLKEKNRAIRN